MKKISYKKYFNNILWFTSTNLLAFVFLIPSIVDLFRDESSVAFGQTEEEQTEDKWFVRWLFRALNFFINLLRAISGFVLDMSASILDYSINFATVFILNNILGGGPVYQVWSSVRDIGNLLIILFLGIIAVSLISGIFGQVTKKSVVWILGAALLINFSGAITTLVYTSGTVISKGFLTKSEGLIISSKRGKTRTSCEKGVAKCISAAVSITSYDESRYEAELFKKLEEAKSDHKKRANAYYEKLAKDKKLTNEQIGLLKSVTFSGETLSSLALKGLRKEYIALGHKGIKPYHAFSERAAEKDFNSKNQTDRKRFIVGLISFALNIVLIVAFLYAALSLLYVGIGIVFLYIISPLGLVSHMITKAGIKSNILEVIKNAWWSNLWGYTFFAPVFLAGLWIAISIYSASYLDSSYEVTDTAADIHFATPFSQDVLVLPLFEEIIKPSDLVKKPFEITVPEVYTSVVIAPLKFISKAAPRIHTTDFFVTCPNIPLIRDTAIIPKKSIIRRFPMSRTLDHT